VRSRAALALALAVAGGAARCGGGGRGGTAPDAAQPAPNTTLATLPWAAGPVLPTTTIATTTTTAPAARPAARPAQAPPPPRANAVASLDSACALPSQPQGLTVRAAPGDAVAYQTSYADGSSSMTKAYASGMGSGNVGPDGEFRASWIVPADAPTGPAVVHYLSRSGRPAGELGFVVAGGAGNCTR
jgi:hypothetical protein